MCIRDRYNIPQRWSIAHLYQAVLNQEPHVSKVRFITTLSGYLHWKLTGERVLGIGDAAGMFPIDSSIRDYHPKMLSQFDELIRENEYPWKIEEILPKVLCAFLFLSGKYRRSFFSRRDLGKGGFFLRFLVQWTLK